jgi:hypothetical protein
MTHDNTTTEQTAQAAKDAAQKAEPAAPETLELPPMLQNTDALEALMKKAAGQLQ